MKPTHTNYRRPLLSALCIVTAMVTMPRTATPFGDNDGGLDLPGLQDPSTPGSGNSSNQSTVDGSLLGVVEISGADTIIVELSDPARGRVTLSTKQPLDLSIVAGSGSASTAQATQSTSDGVTVAAEGADVAVQGGLLLPAGSPYQRHLVAPIDAVAVVSLLLIDSDPEASLEALLDSNVLLDDWHLVDAPGSIDLDGFADLVESKALELSPIGAELSVTWLIATLDGQGQLHLTATRISTHGGPIEVITR